MAYTVKSTEKLRKSAAEHETKTLLYLMNFRADSDEIHYFVVDFFNDLTGMDRMASKLWDAQSKGGKNNGPKAIGKELVTLFKNFVSDFDFSAYVLFVGGVTGTVRIDETKNVFDISNVPSTAYEKMVEGLIEEGKEKTYIENSDLTDENINNFLSKVTIVVDDKDPEEYVKAIIKDHPNIIPEKEVLQAIFNEIRDVQSSKKNINSVEGITIQTSDEVLNYSRHMTSNDVKMLALQRIINRNPVSQGIPTSFVDIYSLWPPEKRKEQLEECIQSLSRALFNKNMAVGFWKLFGSIYNLIVKKPNSSIQYIFNNLPQEHIEACPDFDALSLKYFIAVVKDGIQQ